MLVAIFPALFQVVAQPVRLLASIDEHFKIQIRNDIYAQVFAQANGRRDTAFAVCIDNRGYPGSLELHKIYRVIPDEEAAADGHVRVVDDSGEDCLYPADRFVEIEPPQSVKRSLLHAKAV